MTALLLACLLSFEAPPPVAIRVARPDAQAGASLPFGAPFALEVELEWDASLVPEPFDAAPLESFRPVVRSVERALTDGRIVETRRYLLHPFTLGGVAIGPLQFGAVTRDGRARSAAAAEPLDVTVVGALDPALPGGIEWPAALAESAVQDAGEPWWRRPPLLAGAIAAVAVAAAVAAAGRRRLRLQRGTRASGASARSARQRLLELLAPTAALGPDASSAAVRERCAELADAARALLEAERALPALRRSREELLALLEGSERAGAAPIDRAAIAELLAIGDVAKFSAESPEAALEARSEAAARRLGGDVGEAQR